MISLQRDITDKIQQRTVHNNHEITVNVAKGEGESQIVTLVTSINNGLVYTYFNCFR
jgi:hypothetical protein